MRIWLLALSALGFMACTQQWRLEDSRGQALIISAPRFEPNDRLEFRVGAITRKVEASQIQWLSIDPSKLQVDGARVLYSARLLLRDGTRLPDGSAADTLDGVFVGLDARLVGAAGTGQIQIPLAELRLLEIPGEGKPAPASSSQLASSQAPTSASSSAAASSVATSSVATSSQAGPASSSSSAAP